MSEAVILRRERLGQTCIVDQVIARTEQRCAEIETHLEEVLLKEAQTEILHATTAAAARREHVLENCKTEMLDIILETLDGILGSYCDPSLSGAMLDTALQRYDVGGSMRVICAPDLKARLLEITSSLPKTIEVDIDTNMKPGQAVLYGAQGSVDLSREALIGAALRHLNDMRESLR